MLEPYTPSPSSTKTDRPDFSSSPLTNPPPDGFFTLLGSPERWVDAEGRVLSLRDSRDLWAASPDTWGAP